VEIALLAVVLAGLAAPRRSEAAAEPRVLVRLLRAAPTSPTLAETILRIKSELAANGFDVVVEDIRGGEQPADMDALMARAGRDPQPSATLAIFGDLDRGPAVLWVEDRITSKTAVQRIAVEAADDRRISEVLAIRAEELLRASLVELLLERYRASAPMAAPAKAEAEVEREVAASPSRWRAAVEVGAAGLGDFGGLGPSVAPTVRLRAAVGERFWLRLSGLGFGTQPLVRGGDPGSARVNRSLLLLEGGVWLLPRHRVRPLVSLGVGTERIGVAGFANAPYRGENNARWFAAGDVGAGVAVRVHAHFELQLELHALFTAPRPAVNFFDIEAARGGQPTLMAVLSLAGGA